MNFHLLKSLVLNIEKNYIIDFIIGLILTLIIAGCSECEISTVQMLAASQLPGNLVSEDNLTDKCVVDFYTIRTFRDPDNGGFLEIIKSSQKIFTQQGWSFEIGDRGVIGQNPQFNLLGGDLTGDGKSNLVVYEWSGGAHCCFTMLMFEIDEEFKQIAEIQGRDGVPTFAEMNGDSVPEILLYDMSYSYWPGSFANSPCPRIILKWIDNKYTIATDLMSFPAPSMQELESEASRIRNSERWTTGPDSKYDRNYIPEELFGRALDLMYAGHEDLGWNFIEMAWTKKFPIDQELLEELRTRMASSPYWIKVEKVKPYSVPKPPQPS